MATKKVQQPELSLDTPADITPGTPGDPKAADAELIDDTPDVVKMDLRKFNKAKAKVNLSVANIKAVTVIIDKAGADSMMQLLKEGDTVGKAIEAKRKELGDPYRLQVERVNECAKEIVKELPVAITGGKALILAFHKSEEKKVLDKRTADREKHLAEIGMTPFSKEIDGKIVIYHWTNDQEQMIMTYQVHSSTDDQWVALLQLQATERATTSQAVLQKELEAADFFGDETGAAAVREKIDQVKAAPAAAVSYGGGGSYAAPSTKGLTKRWVFEVTDVALVPRAYLQVDDKMVKDAISTGARSIPGIRIYQDESISLR